MYVEDEHRLAFVKAGGLLAIIDTLRMKVQQVRCAGATASRTVPSPTSIKDTIGGVAFLHVVFSRGYIRARFRFEFNQRPIVFTDGTFFLPFRRSDITKGSLLLMVDRLFLCARRVTSPTMPPVFRVSLSLSLFECIVRIHTLNLVAVSHHTSLA